MNYYAQFVPHGGATFRMDTRIYLSGKPASQADGEPVAAIVGKNPGSAVAGANDEWGELKLQGDKMLPYVRNRFTKAYKLAGKKIPDLAFVQVWNLFYLCDKKLAPAIRAMKLIEKTASAPRCSSESSSVASIIWFAWGGDDRHLNEYKGKFLKTHSRRRHEFFYDYERGVIIDQLPKLSDAVKHPQGLPAQAVEEHLAKIL